MAAFGNGFFCQLKSLDNFYHYDYRNIRGIIGDSRKKKNNERRNQKKSKAKQNVNR